MQIIRWFFLGIVVDVVLVEYIGVYLCIRIPVSIVTKKDPSSFEFRFAPWIDRLLGYPRPHGGFR
ncbi:MAG: hypothetical protein Greene041639_187 [Parcubacteria group bacterium Greene0416_39]|nr:MAG: hypothetical protein Greene041639_187 [Parcubacteria group bacterium Greene0416_39]